MVVHIGNLNPQGVEARESEVQDHSCLRSKFEASLGYLRPNLYVPVSRGKGGADL